MVLDTQPSGAVTVTVGGASGAVTVAGAPLTFTTSDWDTPQPVTVTGACDEDTDDATATLTHTASGGGYDAVAIDAVTVTVTDTTPTLTLTHDPAAVTEGDDIRLTITADRALTVRLTVRRPRVGRGLRARTASCCAAPCAGEDGRDRRMNRGDTGDVAAPWPLSADEKSGPERGDDLRG